VSELWHDLWEGLRNLAYYFRIIWRDRDWDWSFLLALLKRKLERSARYFASEGCWVQDGPEISQQMRVCLKLIGRIGEDQYWRAADRRYRCRYGPAPKAQVTDNIFHTEWPSEECRCYWLECRKDAERIWRLDCDRLFGIMAKHLLEWWD